MPDKRIGTYTDAMRQANREARATCVALAVIVVVWIVGGFGLASSGIEIFHTPVWVFGGCILPWIVAVVVAVVLSRRVFRDFDLDEVVRADAEGQAPGIAVAERPENAEVGLRPGGVAPRIAGDDARAGCDAQSDGEGR